MEGFILTFYHQNHIMFSTGVRIHCEYIQNCVLIIFLFTMYLWSCYGCVLIVLLNVELIRNISILNSIGVYRRRRCVSLVRRKKKAVSVAVGGVGGASDIKNYRVAVTDCKNLPSLPKDEIVNTMRENLILW